MIINWTTPATVATTQADQPQLSRQQQLDQSFESLLSDMARRGVGEDYVQGMKDNQQRFVELIEEAELAGGDAKAFIRNLGPDDRAVLQEVHGLAEPITGSNIDRMSNEGAANLLRMRGEGQDSNRDGLTDTGIGRSFKFPNSNTPADVAAAWETTMEGLSTRDRILAEGTMMAELLLANTRVDDNGRVIAAEPGDVDWVNPFSSNFSYQGWAQKRLDYLEESRHLMRFEDYQRGVLFTGNFLENLKAEGAA